MLFKLWLLILMFYNIKNNMLKAFINSKIKRIGNMLNLKLDSKNKEINLEVMLIGEEAPLTVNIGKYNLIVENDKHFLEINEVSTSRAWLNIIVEETLNGQKIELPSKLAKILKVVV